MPTHRARPSRWPRVRTAAIALTVGATAVAVPLLPASAGGSRSASAPIDDDAGEPILPAEAREAVPTADNAALGPGADREDEAAPADAEGSEDLKNDSEAPDEDDSSADGPDEDAGESDAEADDATGEPAAAPEATEESAASTSTETDGAPAVGEPDRVEGADRVETSVAVARDRFPDGERAAVLASAEDFADALAGSALADHVDGPLLLTDQPRLDERVAAELTDQLASGSTVWLLGGPEALGEGVESAVADLGFPTERLAGPDRYGTAAAIVEEVLGEVEGCELVVATGTDFADGASASGFASATRPLLFTRGERVPGATAEQLDRCAEGEGPSAVTAVGGSAARALARDGAEVLDGVEVTEVVGEDRYETSADLLTLVRGSTERPAQVPDAGGPVTLASGLDYPDALIGGTYGQPVLLTEPEGLPDSVAEALAGAQENIDGVLVVGGPQSVTAATALDAVSLADEYVAAAAGPVASDGEPSAAETQVDSSGPASDDSEPVLDSAAAPEEETSSTSSPTAERRAPASGRPTASAGGEVSPSEPSTSGTSSSAGPTASATGTAARPSVKGDALDASWRTAWDSMMAKKDWKVLEAWAKAQDFGPTVPITGTYDGPSRITSQAQADRLVGKRVTKDVSFPSGSFTVHDVLFEGARIDQQGADVVYRDVLLDAKNGTEFPNYWRIGNGNADLQRVQIRGNQDGLQTYPRGDGEGVKMRYVYIHSPSPTTGGLKGVNTHQDGNQHMAGNLDMQRTVINYSGAKQSALMWKSDHGSGKITARDNLFVRDSGTVMYIQDNPGKSHRWTGLEIGGNVVGGRAAGRAITDFWNLGQAKKDLTDQTIIALPAGKAVPLKHKVTF